MSFLVGLGIYGSVQVHRTLSASLLSSVATEASKMEIRACRTKVVRTICLVIAAAVPLGVLSALLSQFDQVDRVFWFVV